MKKRSYKVGTISAISLVILIPLSLARNYLSKSAEAAWYNVSWDYRVPVTITYSGSTLTTYDVVITLDTSTLITATKMQSDCDDIRLVDSDETTDINYWIEGGCNTTTTQIWATVPSIPDGGKTIYIYYGNSGATNAEQSWSGNFILLNNASCPTGWTSVSGASQTYNDKFPYGAASYTGSGGGSNSHSHTGYSGSVSGSTTVTCTTTDGGTIISGSGHVHSSVGISVNSGTVRPPYLDMVYCSNSDLNIKQNQVALYDSAPSSGWTRFSALDSRYPRGAATYGGTGGANTHTHTTTADTNSGGANNGQNDLAGSRWAATDGHYHSFPAGNTGSGTNTPPYLNMLYYQADSDTTPPDAIITMSTAIPPLGWTRFSALDSKFPLGASSYGGSGGSTTHSHSVSITSGAGSSGTKCYTLSPLATRSSSDHTHTASWTTDSVSNLPAYINTVFIKRDSPVATTSVGSETAQNATPNTPSLDSPTDTSTTIDTTPSLLTTTTDAESDYLRYKIELCENIGMTTNCQTFDQTSSQTGWSGQDAETSTAYASGTQATYTIQAGSELTPGTTYYWRSYAIDPGGSNTWSSTQVTPYSFTENNIPNTPSLDSPTDTETGVSYEPPLKTTATDDDSDYLRYKIELCEDVSMTTNCQTFDQTSSQTGWSGQNTQTNTAYTSGTQATYTIQATLTAEVTYYWRSYAIDPAGTNTWSSTQGTPYSFTTPAVEASSGCKVVETDDDSSVTVHWADASGEDGYELDRSVNDGAYSSLTTKSANTTYHVDSTISQGNSYQYRVRSYAGVSYGDYCYTNQVKLFSGTFSFEGLKFE